MGVYSTISFHKDDHHIKGFSSSTNIHPGSAAHTALHPELEPNFITAPPREDG